MPDRGVGGAGGAIVPPPQFLAPIRKRGADFARHITTGPKKIFWDDASSLINITSTYLCDPFWFTTYYLLTKALTKGCSFYQI